MQALSQLASTDSSLHLDINVLWWHWALLGAWFLFLIIFDVLVLHKQDHVTKLKEAVWQSIGWVALGVMLGAVVWIAYGTEAGTQYFGGYLIEKSLSIDNVFAWSIILTYFKVPKKYQHRVLFWGVLGAIAFRVIFVFAGIALIEKFEPVLIAFGGLLIFSGLKLLRTREEHTYDPHDSRFFKIVKRFIPVSKHLDGHNLFTVENGKHVATMLFMALIVVEFTDIIFAVDSVPAILAMSRVPFIIIASNAAAILGMRSLYFVFDIVKEQFWLLNYALGFLLLFVGFKMFIAPSQVMGYDWFGTHIPTTWSLAVIGFLLVSGIFGSVMIKQPEVLASSKLED